MHDTRRPKGDRRLNGPLCSDPAPNGGSMKERTVALVGMSLVVLYTSLAWGRGVTPVDGRSWRNYQTKCLTSVWNQVWNNQYSDPDCNNAEVPPKWLFDAPIDNWGNYHDFTFHGRASIWNQVDCWAV